MSATFADAGETVSRQGSESLHRSFAERPSRLNLTRMNSDRLLRRTHDIAVLLPFHGEELILRQMENRDQNRA
jgi:hypothetical protein